MSNLHIIGAITEQRMVTLMPKRGSFTKEVCHLWVAQLLDTLVDEGLTDAVIVCDNAPCHNGLEVVFARPEYSNFDILRLGPYSPELNPIEGIWSIVKSHIQHNMRAGYAEMLAGDPEKKLSQVEWRMQFLKRIANEAIAVIKPEHCSGMVQHAKRRFDAVLNLRDL